jgi:hypothetical protein
VRFLIFAASKPNQVALEPIPATGMKHGLFTQGLLAALGTSERGKAGKRPTTVTAREMQQKISSTIKELLPRLKMADDDQIPDFDPGMMPAIKVLCRP